MTLLEKQIQIFSTKGKKHNYENTADLKNKQMKMILTTSGKKTIDKVEDNTDKSQTEFKNKHRKNNKSLN